MAADVAADGGAVANPLPPLPVDDAAEDMRDETNDDQRVDQQTDGVQSAPGSDQSVGGVWS